MVVAGMQLDPSQVAQKYSISFPLALGLGAGLYFEYFRRPQPSPTHYVSGLHRNFENILAARVLCFQKDAVQTLREALRENALWFNLDRAPTTALMGMEMLAEELPHFDRVRDWGACLQTMAETILETRALYRGMYIEFLYEIAPQISSSRALADDLYDIAKEWTLFAAHLQTTNASAQLEQASGLLRRIAFREEHFWGNVIDL